MDDDYLAITRLQAAYGDAVTRQAWPELTAMFMPDCPVRLDLHTGDVIEKIGSDEIGAFIASSIERYEFFAFTLQNSVVDVRPDGLTATGRLYIQELRQERATHRWTTALGLYRDTYCKVDGGWLFATRNYSTLARTPTPDTGDGSMEVFPIPGPAPGDAPH